MSEPNNTQPTQANHTPANAAPTGVSPYAPPVKQSTSGLAIAGLVLGIIAALTSFLPIINNASFFIALLGLALAIAGFVSTRKGKHSGKGIAIAGIVLGIASAAIVLATQAMYSAAIDAVSDELTSGTTPVATSAQQDGESGETDETGAAETDYQNLAVGTAIDLKDGLTVSVNSIESGLANYDGSEVVCVNVTYVNNGDKNAYFNVFDWKAEDGNGAQRDMTYYADSQNELNSGQLSAGGSVTGNVYFDAPIAKVHYYNSIISDNSTAAWVA